MRILDYDLALGYIVCLPQRRSEAGLTILDYDLALGYRLEHYPDLLSPFACPSDAPRLA